MRIAFLGGGNMATSLVGALRAGGVDAASMTVAEPLPARSESLAREFGVHTTSDNVSAARGADTIVIAVKPQDVRVVATGIAGAIADRRRLVVSVAAGIRLADLDRWLGGHAALVRAMPNRPALIDVVVTPEAVSSDAKSGLAWVPDLQALAAWDEAERNWRDG